MHCELRVHAPPKPCGDWQAPPLTPSHQNMGRQFASPAPVSAPQAVRHAPAVHTKLPMHGPVTAPPEHVPPPQLAKVVIIGPVHELALQAWVPPG
jgi:hypothetical protein